MAPEILNGKLYNYKVDMWSLGVTIFEALTGNTPFTARNKEELIINVNNGFARIPTTIDLSSCCLDFLSKCLHYDPD